MAYNNNWAKTDWPDAAKPTGKDINDWNKSFEVWGWGRTPGSVTVNANGNTLTGLAVLSGNSGRLKLDATLLNLTPDSVDDGTNYGKAIQIVRADTAAQHQAWVRYGQRVVALGYLPSTSTFGFGAGTATDSSFAPSYFCITVGGNVGFGDTSPTAKVQVQIPAIANTIGAAGWLQRWKGASPGGNADELLLQQVRYSSSTSGWEGTQWRLGRAVDGVGMADLVWDNFDLCIYTSGVERARYTVGGRMRLATQTTYANDAAAGSGGLSSGDVYWTSTGELRRKL